MISTWQENFVLDLEKSVGKCLSILFREWRLEYAQTRGKSVSGQVLAIAHTMKNGATKKQARWILPKKIRPQYRRTPHPPILPLSMHRPF